MIYTPLTKKALRIAFGVHKDQVDKTGLPYIFHPFHLAEQMETEDEVIVALLHDVVEDSDMTLADLRADGFPDHAVDAIALLTHDDTVKYEYMDYISKIKANPLAAKIKLADLRHNSDVTRLDSIDEKMAARLEKYRTAIKYLEK
jgi:(p)ppGpp synthase/HD superfamily hydrolase